MQILKSKIDNSVNFVEDQLVGFIESRYVRRSEKYFTAYLSTQTGCNRGCKFCHLTVTNQTQFKDLIVDDILEQAKTIFQQYDNDNTLVKAGIVHLAFMARGEALANKILESKWTELLLKLGTLATDNNLVPKFNVSTIMPVTMKRSLTKTFPIITPTIYYSMYSTNQYWRDIWMPAAMKVDDAIAQLQEYQKSSKKIVKVHGAFISGENDSKFDIDSMIQVLDKLQVEFNIVRYNPYSLEQGT
jgi:adenine C2-methylase RlmN of 23S rRNA A2503 and tRNA A37